MNIRLAYGKKGLSIELPDGAPVTVLEPAFVEALADPRAELARALRRPLAGPSLRALVKPSDRVGIVFNDITRPTPNPLILAALLAELEAASIPAQAVTLFNATGTHRANSEAELKEMLGEQIAARYRIVQNDARAADGHVSVGVTSSGNEIRIHREFVECTAKILTGFIEPHFFAGYSGGGKAVMPGLARLDTVMRNHSARNLDSPLATWGITRGNPLWQEVLEAARMVRPTFLVNVALNRDKAITAVFAGEMEEAHARGCAYVKGKAMAPVEKAFDIVITSNSGYPLDLNLYQAVKGMSAAAQVVRQGGSIIIAAECWDGIPEHGSYGALLAGAGSNEEILRMVRAPGFAREDMWQAHIQALIGQKARVYVYSEGLSDEEIRRALLTPCRSIEQTVAELRASYGAAARICVLPEGPQTIPYIEGGH